jgi:hypothetical protein
MIHARQPAPNAVAGITAMALAGEHSSGVTSSLRSRRAITLVVPNLDPQQTRLSAQDFTLQSSQDPAYQLPLPATRLGFDRQVTGFVDDRTAITETCCYRMPCATTSATS